MTSSSGDATNVGSIVGYLTLNRTDWSAGVRDTKKDSAEIGRLSPNIRIGTNTADVLGKLALVQAAERQVGSEAGKAKPFVVNLWAALAAVAPAALPIAAVAGGALIGMMPVVAAVALGIRGISKEFKYGALQGTAYAQDINFLRNYLHGLQQTAASGLLNGLDQAIKQSRPELRGFKSEIGDTSAQFGNIMGNAIPALLHLLHQFAPLFASIGNELTRGAAKLNDWAHNTTGIRSFVAYVQAELPHVEQFLGELFTLLGHLAQGSSVFGGQMLIGLTTFVRLLNAIPIGVLQVAVPLAVSLYTAFKAYGLATALINGTNKAVTALGTTFGVTGPKAEAFALQQTAAGLQIEAAAAGEAATVARAKALEAQAAAEAAVDIAAAAEAVSSVLAAGAVSTAEYAIDEAASFQAAANAATASAAQIAAAAQAAADASLVSGEESALGWSSMLGPVGIAIGAVAFFGLTMSDSGQSAIEAKQAQDSYSDSVQKSTNALSKANVAQTEENLSKAGAYAQLQKLHEMNQVTTLSTEDLNNAVNGSTEAYTKVIDQLQNVVTTAGGGDAIQGMLTEQGQAAITASGDLKKYRDGLVAQIQQQKLLTDAQRAQQQADNGGTTATLNQAHALGVSRTAYLDAQVAAKKNTDQTKQQTLAFQLERNAAGLLSQALNTLRGKDLGVAESRTASLQATHALLDALKKSKGAIDNETNSSLASQAAAQSKVEADRQQASAIAAKTHSNDRAIESYKKSKQALEDELRAHGRLTPAVQRYIDKLYSVKAVSDYLNKHPVAPKVKPPDTSAAQSKLDKLVTTMQIIGTGVTATVNITTVDKATGTRHLVKAQAAGGPVDGPGTRGVDSQLRLLAPGEWVINDQAVAALTAKYGPGALPTINRGALPAAAPLSVPSGRGGYGAAGSPGSGAMAAAQTRQTTVHGGVNIEVKYPEPEPASESIPRAARMAAAQLDGFG